jgi:hypothetical protein
VEKMKKGIFPPALSEQELKNLSIQLPIVKWQMVEWQIIE